MKLRRKLICMALFMLFGMVISTATVMAENVEPTLVVNAPTQMVNAGGEFDIGVSVLNNPGIAGFTLDVKYDNTKFDYVRSVRGEVLAAAGLNILSGDGNTNGYQRVRTFAAGYANFSSDGVLYTLHFKVKDTAPAGSYGFEILYDDGDVVNQTLQILRPAIVNGQVTIAGETETTVVTVTPPANVIYGEALSEPSATATAGGTDFTFTYSGTPYDGSGTITNSSVKPVKAGNYTVTATLISSTHMGSGTATFTIARKPLTATVNAASKTYGDPNPAFTASFNGFVYGDNSLQTALNLQTNATATSSAGAYDVTSATGTGNNGNYVVTLDGANKLTVNKKPVTATADNKSRAFGQANPAFTFSFNDNDLVGSETRDALGITLSCAANATSPAGTYPITGTSVSANYDVNVMPGTLTVEAETPVTYTIIATASTGGAVTGGGIFSENATVTLIAMPYSGYNFDGWYEGGNKISAEAVYSFVVTANRNFEARFIESLPINTIVTVTPPSDVIYGEVLGDPSATATAGGSNFTFTYYGTPYDGSGTITNSSVKPVKAGSYTVTATLISNTHTGSGTATFTIARKPLTATVNSVVKTYGDPNPAFTATYNGFVYGDNSLQTALTLQTNATVTSPADTYDVTSATGTGNNGNYVVTLDGANKLTVNKKPVTATADNKSRAFGHANPAFTFSFNDSELVGSDTREALGITLSCAADATSPAGIYPITGISVNANYDVNVVPGTLTIEAETPVTYTIIATASTGGTVTGGGIFNENAAVTLIATPYADYSFDGWYEGGSKVAVEAIYSFAATANRNLEARFVESSVSVGIPVFTDANGAAIDHLTSTTLITSMSYLNDSVVSQNLTMCVAIYSSDGRLKYMGTDAKQIASLQEQTFRVSLDLSDNLDGIFAKNGYYVKVFLWDSITFVPVNESYFFQ